MLLPDGCTLAGRHDGIPAGRIYLSRSPAGEHAHISMPANDRDTVNLRGIDWEHAVVILQENDALLFYAPRNLKSLPNIHNALPRRIVDNSGQELRIQNAPRMVVNLR